jgi:hypothetical protein
MTIATGVRGRTTGQQASLQEIDEFVEGDAGLSDNAPERFNG